MNTAELDDVLADYLGEPKSAGAENGQVPVLQNESHHQGRNNDIKPVGAFFP